ncbi:MerR family DNA-binding transcriptional regulator [Limosilactobacillus gastricus]|uniref:MerR family DNA-binding transcriptional regulator n=1 Tax=Limosilactobacillus gastricus TaxID=227942 RepID=UPI0002E65117|nr:MerR family DNA-binding transcriptional regulator [Limosilactobacillus gastricus]
MSEKTYTIKQVAELVNESDHTIRFYCKEGLFPFAKRDRNNVRRFTELTWKGWKSSFVFGTPGCH